MTIFAVKNFEGVTQFKMGTTFWGKFTPLTVSAYLVDGLLVDGGSFNSREQLIQACGNQVNQMVLTHHHVIYINATPFGNTRLNIA